MSEANKQAESGSGSSHCYRAASEKMGHQFFSTTLFIVNALDWLANKFGDVHLEYHEAEGWQVSTCYAEGQWGEDKWVSGEDGGIASALLKAVEITSR